MRSVIYGALITAFLASAETVHAAGELDGKSLLCEPSNRGPHLFYGLVFDQGKVARHDVKGYSKVIAYNRPYRLEGTKLVRWGTYSPRASKR